MSRNYAEGQKRREGMAGEDKRRDKSKEAKETWVSEEALWSRRLE